MLPYIIKETFWCDSVSWDRKNILYYLDGSSVILLPYTKGARESPSRETNVGNINCSACGQCREEATSQGLSAPLETRRAGTDFLLQISWECSDFNIQIHTLLISSLLFETTKFVFVKAAIGSSQFPRDMASWQCWRLGTTCVHSAMTCMKEATSILRARESQIGLTTQRK